MNEYRIVYVVNHVAFFVSHRLPLALGAKKTGYKVKLLTGQAGSDDMESMALLRLSAAGIAHQRTVFHSASINPVIETLGLLQLIWCLRKLKPDVVHCASPKGVLYGGIAARLCGVRGLVLAISGMGYAYTDSGNQSAVRRIIKFLYSSLASFAFRHPNVRVIVQNQDDRAAVLATGWVRPTALVLIPGSGVDLTQFVDCNPFKKNKTVLMPARMLKDKGVLEFVAAARIIKAIVHDWRFVLAGAAGYDNPSAISKSDLQTWQTEGVVEWLGHVDDMMPLFREASIVCLPSYREGMPKALLEAAASGCAVVTTDVTGCREAIVPGKTGLLVPVRDSEALSDALLSLINDVDRLRGYGLNGKLLAAERFSLDSVVAQTIKIYKGLIGNG